MRIRFRMKTRQTRAVQKNRQNRQHLLFFRWKHLVDVEQLIMLLLLLLLCPTFAVTASVECV